jgi:hypothetical protein
LARRARRMAIAPGTRADVRVEVGRVGEVLLPAVVAGVVVAVFC